MEKEKVIMKKGTGNCNTSITIRIPENLKDKVEEQAEGMGMSISTFIRFMLEEYTKKYS